MRLRFPTFRAAVAAGLSVWMAVLACLIGCTVPILANSGSINPSSTHQDSTKQSQPDLMADMPDCPHHSGGNAPAKQNDPKPVRGGGKSCCPVEVTVTSKPVAAKLQIAPAGDFVLAPDFSLATIRSFHSAEFVPPVWHSGRDTLLETGLLRI